MCREQLSAHADGELDPELLDGVRDHVTGCAGCEAFERDLAVLTRATRVRMADRVPDLSPAVLARVPGAPAPIRVRVWAQYGLVVVALTQLILSLPELLPATHASAPIHLEHHLGAWDVAMAIGLLVAAWQPERARGLLPMALALGGILVFTAAIDVVGGDTAVLSEAPHVLELAGVVLLWCLARPAARRPWRVLPA
jgi:predicted anti-sigma-YlaC factor YlaD